MDLTNSELSRLRGHVDYLKNTQMTFENKEQYYEEYGYLISIVKNISYPKFSELIHTFRKEVEDLRATSSKQEFLNSSATNYLPVVKSDIVRLESWIESKIS